jgi:hypothetical protein
MEKQVKRETDDHHDWKYESKDSITARVKIVSDLQARTRASLIACTVASVVIFVALYNAYYSYDYSFIRDKGDTIATNNRPDLATHTPASVLYAHALKSWADSRVVSVGLLGLKISVDDFTILGALALAVLTTWLFLRARAENHAVGRLLQHTNGDPGSDSAVDGSEANSLRWLIAQSAASGSLFSPRGGAFRSISSLSTRQSRQGQMGPFFFKLIGICFIMHPAMVAVIAMYVDKQSYFWNDLFLKEFIKGTETDEHYQACWWWTLGLTTATCLACSLALYFVWSSERVLQEYLVRLRARRAATTAEQAEAATR